MIKVKQGGDFVGYIESSEELMSQIANMDRDNSVFQFSIPGKGKFTLVLQEEDEPSIKADVENNPQLKQMIEESKSEYKMRKGMSTAELLDSLSAKDFE
ncbi:hypothetical protein [Lentibacillus sp. JNUCC-1]|uniref:hypothetical protein n=1 Tax=Lentibacillus sp. JNUCC-1 TaxID=2654513 RepID=UPI0012E86D36|nr:hypothetical protein [Lentibacillus sp. JNUCC-1]